MGIQATKPLKIQCDVSGDVGLPTIVVSPEGMSVIAAGVTDLPEAGVAPQLAVAVGNQWTPEVAMRPAAQMQPLPRTEVSPGFAPYARDIYKNVPDSLAMVADYFRRGMYENRKRRLPEGHDLRTWANWFPRGIDSADIPLRMAQPLPPELGRDWRFHQRIIPILDSLAERASAEVLVEQVTEYAQKRDPGLVDRVKELSTEEQHAICWNIVRDHCKIAGKNDGVPPPAKLSPKNQELLAEILKKCGSHSDFDFLKSLFGGKPSIAFALERERTFRLADRFVEVLRENGMM